MQLDSPDAIEEAFQISHKGLQFPSIKNLKSMLRSLLYSFEEVYIFLDALDESPKVARNDHECARDELMKLIHEICSWDEACLHLLLTSREEQDIKRYNHSFFHSPYTIGHHIYHI